jgi:uncharacterized protein
MKTTPTPSCVPSTSLSMTHNEALLIGAAAGVMRLYAHFLPQRDGYLPKTGTVIPRSRKIGRNEPCPCRSGQKYKKCCGSEATFH